MYASKKIAILLYFIFCLLSFAKSQHSDCSNMLILKDTIYHTSAISGFGSKREFDGNTLSNKKAFEKEKNTIWYFIKIPEDGVFTFDIIAKNAIDDWDFLLFEYKKMFCKRIEDNKISPIRTNLSRSATTGLSRKVTEKFVGAGINSNYSKPIQAVKGDRYVLVVNNSKRANGKHTLKLHYPKKKKIQKEVTVASVEKEEVKTILFKLSIKDAATKKRLPSNVIISGLRKKTIELNTVTNYETQIVRKNHTAYINVCREGYMLTSKEFKIAKAKLEYSAEVLLEKIESGKSVNLKNIQFYGNRFDFLPGAEGSLKALLSFMNQNPKVIIEVEGHVNGPGQKNSKEYQELSYNRAYAVRAYLVKSGINKNRIDFKGYGNSKMLYPEPKSSYQESANRRVEIKILSNE